MQKGVHGEHAEVDDMVLIEMQSIVGVLGNGEAVKQRGRVLPAAVVGCEHGGIGGLAKAPWPADNEKTFIFP